VLVEDDAAKAGTSRRNAKRGHAGRIVTFLVQKVAAETRNRPSSNTATIDRRE